MKKQDQGSSWLRFFAAAGLYALTVKLLQLFADFGQRTRQPVANAFPAVDTDAFLNALSTWLDTPVRHGGSVRLLNNGVDFFPALLRAIRSAEHSIHLMTYIWKRSDIGDRVFEALLDRLRRGVEVRVMVDGMGSFSAPKAQFEALRKAGAKIVVFSPIVSSQFVRLDRRNHRRAFVIDGRIGFTGGMSIADAWKGDAGDPYHWRDTMVEVRGPLAQTLQVSFLQLWVQITGEQLVGDKYFPAPQEEADAEGLRHIGIAHSPAGEIQPMLHFLWFSLMAARRQIYIANAYFAPNRYLREALMAQARAGVDVRLLLPGPHTDNKLVRWAAQGLYDEFLEAGIRIYEYVPTMIHAKHLVIDGKWTVIGSSNIDIRSIKLNHENVLGILDEGLARQMLETFEEDFRRSREVVPARWRHRPAWYGLRAKAAGLLRAQY